MTKKIRVWAFWLCVATVAVAVPVACSSSSTSDDGSSQQDTSSEKAPVDMTSSG